MTLFDNKPPSSGPTRVRPHGNLNALRIAVLVLFAILVVRLVDMQIVRGSEYQERSRNNHIQSQQLLPARGLIYDAQMRPLVENVGFYSATIVPELLPASEEHRRTMYRYLEDLLGVPALEMSVAVAQAEAEGTKNQAIAVKRHLTREEALHLREVEADMPGVSVTIEQGRRYVGGETFSPLLGYIGLPSAEEWPRLREQGYQFNQPVGKFGIELMYEAELRGEVGWSSNEVNAFGDIVTVLKTEDPVPGNSLRMSIDLELQEFIEEILWESMQEATKAGAVVMDVNTGAVLGMVSVPTYDNNMFGQIELYEDQLRRVLDDPRKPLLAQAVHPAAPGSTFKLLTAAAALQEGNVTPATGRNVDSLIKWFEGDDGVAYAYHDWAVHGYVNLHSAIARSSNIYFYMASCGFQDEGIKGIGDNVWDSAYLLRYYAQRFGYGRPTGIDTGDEASGIIPDPEWKRQSRSDRDIFAEHEAEWYHADTCFMGIGQGDVTATPLQVTRMTAAIANGGRLVVPRTVWQVLSPEGEVVKIFDPEWEEVPVNPQHLEEIRHGMLMSVAQDWGAGRLAYIPGLGIAGKTGTAEFRSPDGRDLEHAWFTGYYPYDDPQVAITVFFDLGVGGLKAAPVAGKILAFYDELQRQRAVRSAAE
jgi:penicillin-binding protein 2